MSTKTVTYLKEMIDDKANKIKNDNSETAGSFNNFFTGIGRKLSQSLMPKTDTFSKNNTVS